MRQLLAILWGLLFPFFIYGQTYSLTTYQLDDGLPSHVVQQTIQDSTGYIWVATNGGLARFDGKNFRLFEGQLKSQNIKGFSYDKGGQLFFLNDSGLYSVENENGTDRIAEVRQKGLKFPNSIFHDSQNRCWLSQPDGKAMLLLKDELTEFDLGEEETLGTSDSRFSFAEDRHGNLFLGTPKGGLFYFDEAKEEFVLRKRIDAINQIKADGDSLWVGGTSLYYFQTQKSGKLSRLRRIPTGGFEISCLAKNGLGDWFVGTKGESIFHLKRDNGSFTWNQVFGSNDPHRVNELPFKNINDLYFVVDSEGEEGQLWVSSREGLGLLQLRFFERIPEASNNNVFSITEGGEGVNVSFGNAIRITENKNNFDVYNYPDVGRSNSLVASEGGLWQGTADGELVFTRNRQVVHKHDLTGRGGGIFHLLSDEEESIWFCQAPKGLPIIGVGRRLPSGELIFYNEEHQLNTRILVVKESPRGEIFLAGIGRQSYLYRYRPEEGTFENLSLDLPFREGQNFEVHDMAIDDRDMIYLATTNGLLRYDSERVRRIDLGEMTQGEFRAVTTVPNGGVWASSSIDGLVYFDGNGFVHFGENSGLPSRISSYRSMTIGGNGRLWVGMAEGLVYSVEKNPIPQKSVKPIFSNILVDDKKLKKKKDSKFKEGGELLVDFVSLSYPGHEISYQYKLNKTRGNILDENQWSEPTFDNQVIFENLEAGEYILSVQAKQPGGFAWSESAEWPFKLTRVWYKSWWAKVLFGLFFLFIFWTYVRIYVLKLIKRIRSLEHLLARQTIELEQKEAMIEEQSKELTVQKEELEETNINMNILHYLVYKIDEESKWDEVIKVIGNRLEIVQDIHAFEITALYDKELIYKGYSKKEKAFTYRKKVFNDKTSLTSWVHTHNRSIMINDFKVDHDKYVKRKKAHYYQSMILMPFKLKNGTKMSLNLYSLSKDAFTKWEQKTMHILTIYLSHVIHDELNSNQ